MKRLRRVVLFPVWIALILGMVLLAIAAVIMLAALTALVRVGQIVVEQM